MKCLQICCVIIYIFTMQIQFGQGECDKKPDDPQKFIPPDLTGSTGLSEEQLRRAQINRNFYEGCETLKYCVSPGEFIKDARDNCIKGGTCWIAMSYGSVADEEYHDDLTEIPNTLEIVGLAKSWIAIAFKPKEKEKAEAYQLECMKNDATGEVELWESYYTSRGQNQARRLININNRLSRLNGSDAADGLIYCRFFIKKKFFNPPTRFNFEESSYKLLFSKGDQGTTGVNGKIEADLECIEDLDWEGPKLNFSKYPVPNNANRQHLVYHATYMLVPFLILIPIGGFYTRYYKALFPKDVDYTFYRIWLLIHIFFELVAYLMILKGLDYGSKFRKTGWNKHPWGFHQVVGLLCCAFRLSHFMYFAILRTKTFPRAGPWNYRMELHQVTAHLTFIAVLNMLMNLDRVPFSGMTCRSKSYLIVWIIFHYSIHFLMSLYNYFVFLYSLCRISFSGRFLWATFHTHVNLLTLYQIVFQPDYRSNKQPFIVFRFLVLIAYIATIISLTVTIDWGMDNSKLRHICHEDWTYYL